MVWNALQNLISLKLLLTGYRILRCNPLSHKVFDPVPLSKKEKQLKQLIKKASTFDEELLAIINDHKHFDLEQHMNHLITIIWENHFGSVEKVNATNIKMRILCFFMLK